MSESKTTEKARPILEVQGLTKYFDAAKGKKWAKLAVYDLYFWAYYFY